MEPEEKELPCSACGDGQGTQRFIAGRNLIAELCELRMDASDEGKEKLRASSAAWE